MQMFPLGCHYVHAYSHTSHYYTCCYGNGCKYSVHMSLTMLISPKLSLPPTVGDIKASYHQTNRVTQEVIKYSTTLPQNWSLPKSHNSRSQQQGLQSALQDTSKFVQHIMCSIIIASCLCTNQITHYCLQYVACWQKVQQLFEAQVGQLHNQLPGILSVVAKKLSPYYTSLCQQSPVPGRRSVCLVAPQTSMSGHTQTPCSGLWSPQWQHQKQSVQHKQCTSMTVNNFVWLKHCLSDIHRV